MRTSIGTGLEPYLAAMSSRDLKALRDGIAAMQRLMAIEGMPGDRPELVEGTRARDLPALRHGHPGGPRLRARTAG